MLHRKTQSLEDLQNTLGKPPLHIRSESEKKDRSLPPRSKFHKRDNPKDIIFNIHLVLRKKLLPAEQLFIEKELQHNFWERHFDEGGKLLEKNYFFQVMQNLYVLSLSRASKKKKKRSASNVKPKEVCRLPILIGEIKNSEEEVTPPPLPATPATPAFTYDHRELLLNCAILARKMVDAHNNVMVKQNGESFKYIKRFAALAKVLKKADDFFQDLESPVKSHDLMASLVNLQNSLETPSTRFLREHPGQSQLIFGMTMLLGLSLLGAGLLLLPAIPLAAMNMLIAGSVMASIGLIAWMWTPVANWIAPDPDFAEVAQTTSKMVNSFRALIDSSASFFHRDDNNSVIRNHTNGTRPRMKAI